MQETWNGWGAEGEAGKGLSRVPSGTSVALAVRPVGCKPQVPGERPGGAEQERKGIMQLIVIISA